jgi:hypothetical protein
MQTISVLGSITDFDHVRNLDNKDDLPTSVFSMSSSEDNADEFAYKRFLDEFE